MIELGELFTTGDGRVHLAAAILGIMYIATASIGLQQDHTNPGPKSRKDFLSLNLVAGVIGLLYALYKVAQTIMLI